MVATPERSTDVKLVQPLNAPLGCIITGVQPLELAFMFTTTPKFVKTKECCNASPWGDDHDEMRAINNVVDSSRTCRERWFGARAGHSMKQLRGDWNLRSRTKEFKGKGQMKTGGTEKVWRRTCRCSRLPRDSQTSRRCNHKTRYCDA